MLVPSQLTAFALLSCLCPAVHAGVLTVDDDGSAQYASIAAAVSAAVDGDIILVKSGLYSSFTVNGIGLTIEAESGGTVALNGSDALIKVHNIPFGKTVTLRGIDVTRTTYGLPFTPDDYVAFYGQANAGSVWVEDCEIRGGPSSQSQCSGVGAARFDDSASVVIINSTLAAGTECHGDFELNQGLQVWNSSVWVLDSTVLGGGAENAVPGDSYFGSPLAGAGINAYGSQVTVSGSIVRGGNGGNGYDGISLEYHCVSGGTAGDGIEIWGGSAIQVHSSIVSGGIGGIAGIQPAGSTQKCYTGIHGEKYDHLSIGNTVLELPGVAGGLQLTSPVREGQTLNLDWSGQPGDFGLLTFGPASQNGASPAGWISSLFLPAPYATLALGTLPPSGTGALSFVVPELGPGVSGVTLYAQCALIDLTSGTVTLSAPSRSVLLDSSL